LQVLALNEEVNRRNEKIERRQEQINTLSAQIIALSQRLELQNVNSTKDQENLLN